MTIPRLGKLLLIGMAWALPLAASAQAPSPASGDAAYCGKLIGLYRTYINNPSDPRPAYVSPVAEDEVAIARCKAGDTAAGIPRLEKVLRNVSMTLPARG
jgi:hypothetical protein